MKSIAIITIFLIYGPAFSQLAPRIIPVSLTKDTSILYRAFNNVVKILRDASDTNTYTLIGSGCVISPSSEQGSNEYVVKVSEGTEATLHIALQTDSGNRLIESRTFAIRNVPYPVVYIDQQASGSTIGRDMRVISVGVDQSAALDFIYDVTGWTSLIDGAIYTGNNYMPTEELQTVIQSLPSGSKVELLVQCVRREDGVTYKFKGVFTLE